jgi:hypothetical protein
MVAWYEELLPAVQKFQNLGSLALRNHKMRYTNDEFF